MSIIFVQPYFEQGVEKIRVVLFSVVSILKYVFIPLREKNKSFDAWMKANSTLTPRQSL